MLSERPLTAEAMSAEQATESDRLICLLLNTADRLRDGAADQAWPEVERIHEQKLRALADRLPALLAAEEREAAEEHRRRVWETTCEAYHVVNGDLERDLDLLTETARWLTAERDALRDVLAELTQQTACVHDAGGRYCASHSERLPCPHADAQRLLAEGRPRTPAAANDRPEEARDA